jgi:hypothetical protein
MMNVSRFLKGGFNDFERSCLWDLRPIRIDTCQPLGKVGQEATVLVSGVVHIYRYRIYREGGTRRNAQLLPRISLMN